MGRTGMAVRGSAKPNVVEVVGADSAQCRVGRTGWSAVATVMPRDDARRAIGFDWDGQPRGTCGIG